VGAIAIANQNGFYVEGTVTLLSATEAAISYRVGWIGAGSGSQILDNMFSGVGTINPLIDNTFNVTLNFSAPATGLSFTTYTTTVELLRIY
jgi:hypothetical protein